MNQEIKTKWLNALRSGEYKQGRSALHRKESNTFCCLGVLCDLYIKETGLGYWINPTGVQYFVNQYGAEEDAGIPETVEAWAGRPIDKDHHYDRLITLNDALKYSFDQIADVIEREF